MDSNILTSWKDYELLDSGHGRKLERFGDILLSRPAPQALWPRKAESTLWTQISGDYIRSSTGGGHWNFYKSVPESWMIQWKNLHIKVKPTGFGHLGVFPEQVFFWNLLTTHLAKNCHHANVLNLFAYTGYSTLAAAKMNAKVTHVDGAKSAVTWARENAEANDLKNHPIRWIADDVGKFMTRENKRGVKYDAIIMDPPTFGRSPQGKVWKIEQDLLPLLQSIQTILSDNFQFLLFTCHSQHVSATGVANLLNWMFEKSLETVTIDTGEILIYSSQPETSLPSGVFGTVISTK
ncbi:MAG: class I SAM-dependent methyltransferase [bacterium]